MAQKRFTAGIILLRVLVIGTVIFFLFPLYWMISSSLKNTIVAMQIPPQFFPSEPTVNNYIKLFSANPALRWFFNSVLVAACTMLLVVTVSSMAAYALAKIRFAGSRIVFGIIIAVMTLPHSLMFLPLFKMMSTLNLFNSYLALILPVVGWPFGVFLLKQFMTTIPSSLIEAATIDGAGQPLIFTRIILPLAAPGIGALSIFIFLYSWNDYIWQTLMIKEKIMYTLPIGVNIAKQVSEEAQNFGFAMAGATVASIPAIIVFIAFQKYFTTGLTLGSVKG